MTLEDQVCNFIGRNDRFGMQIRKIIYTARISLLLMPLGLLSCFDSGDIDPGRNQGDPPAVMESRRPLLHGRMKGSIVDSETGAGLSGVRVIYNVFILGTDGIYQSDVLITSSIPDQAFTSTDSRGNFSYGYETIFLAPGQEDVRLMVDLQCEKNGYITLNPLFFETILNPSKSDTIAARDIVYDLQMRRQ